MSNYTAPLDDMRFVLRELVDLASYPGMPGCEEIEPGLVDAILEEAGRFAAEVLAPLNASGDREGSRLADGRVQSPKGFAEAYRQFAEGGWTGLGAHADFGGQDLPEIIAKPVAEMWKSANLAFSLCPMLTQGAVETLRHHASEELKALYLPPMVAGDWTGTMNLTEPGAGSDLAAIKTRALPEGDLYRISGTKIFITWGEHELAGNIVHLVLARIAGAPEGVKGISLFLVPKYLPGPDGGMGERNDLVCASIEHKLGIHASPTAVMNFGDGPGAVGWLVGEPNRGLEYMFTMMNHARLAVGLEGVAVSERALQQARAWARERVQGSLPGDRSGARVTIAHHPDVRRMLMTMRAQTEAMRALAYVAAGHLDRAARHPDAVERRRHQAMAEFLTPVVKGWCTETSLEVTSLGIQVHGGMGYVEETGAAQYLRDARITTIYEGTTGIQANDLLNRKLLRDEGATLTALLEQVRDDAAALAWQAELAEVGGALADAAVLLAEAGQALLERRGAPLETHAAAVPFLMLTGTVLGGWQMARAARAAARSLAAGEGDAAFLAAKIATARFYAAQILPRATAYAAQAGPGADAALLLGGDAV